MRPDVDLSRGLHEVPCVICLVSTHTHRPAAPSSPSAAPLCVQHQESCVALRRPIGLHQQRIHDEAMPVLHQHMEEMIELGFLPMPLAVETCIGVRLRFM